VPTPIPSRDAASALEATQNALCFEQARRDACCDRNTGLGPVVMSTGRARTAIAVATRPPITQRICISTARGTATALTSLDRTFHSNDIEEPQ
jgi:hypothetical protein